MLCGDAALSTRRAAATIFVQSERGTEWSEGFSAELPDAVLGALGPAPDHAINGAEIRWTVKALEI